MYQSPIRNLKFGATAPEESVNEQGMIGDFVDSVQRGFYQGMAGTAESVNQLTGFGGGIRDWLNTQADKQISEMSEAGQNALTQEIFTEDENGNLTLGEGALNARTWMNYLGQGIGTIGSFIGTGGAGGAVAKGGAKLLASAVGRKALENAAKKEAAKLGFKGAAKNFVANGAVSVVVGNGMIANGERDKYNNMSFQELQNSRAFSDRYWEMREDPLNSRLSDEEIGLKARSALAEEAAELAYYDPKMTAVNTLGGLAGAVGGRGLGVTGNVFNPAQTAKSGIVKGFVIEGAQEGSQGGTEQLVSNEIYKELVNPDYDVMTGVTAGALNEAVIGGVLGGKTGGIEGYLHGRKIRSEAENATEESPALEPAQIEASPEQRAVESPITGNTSLDTELNRLDDSSKATSEALQGAKERQIENQLSARREASRSALIDKGVLPERNEYQDTLDLARAYNPDRYKQIEAELSNPDIDSDQQYVNQLESELMAMADEARNLGVDPLQTNIDARVDANKQVPDAEQRIRQKLTRYQDNDVVDRESALEQGIEQEPDSLIQSPEALALRSQMQTESLVNNQNSAELRRELEQSARDKDARSRYGLDEDYQPTEAAQRIREEQGIALRDDLDYLSEAPPASNVMPTDGPTETAQKINEDLTNQDIELNQQSIPSRRDFQAAEQQSAQEVENDGQSTLISEMRSRLSSDRASNFNERPSSMKLREQGKKPIKDFSGISNKTKGMSKRLKRRIQRSKGFDSDTVLSEFQNHEKRLQAFEAEARKQAEIEASKPENIARRKSAEALFAEKMGSQEAADFKENLITSTMNNVNQIVDRSQGTVLEMDGKTVSLPEVKRQLSNGVRTLANKFIGKTAAMNERLRAIKQSESSNESESVSNVQSSPESVQERTSEVDNADSSPGTKSEPQQETQSEKVTDFNDEVDNKDQVEQSDKTVSDKSDVSTKPEGKPTDKIEDFGETLHGAKKHTWGKFGEALNKDLSDGDYESEPLSKLFPKPNLKQLNDQGATKEQLALISWMRGGIPSKPRGRSAKFKLARWVENVKNIRKLTGYILDGKVNARDVSSLESTMGKVLQDVAPDLTLDQIETLGNYEAVYHNVSKEYVFRRLKSYGRERISAKSIEDLIPLVRDYFKNQSADQTKQASGRKRADLAVYYKRFTGERFIGLKVGSRVVEIKSGFADGKEARAYLNENRTALEDEVIARRKEARKQVRGETNRDRTGIIDRDGNVTPEEFSKTFGFRGVQFGNWVEGKRRQQDLNRAYDSLVDLARLMGVPTKAVSLNGKLGLAFGARGSGGKNAASAHFEPGTFVINLTKNSGAGTLAHEWFHALDSHFGKGEAVTKRSRVDQTPDMRSEMITAWNNLINAVKKSDMTKRSSERDKYRTKPYWSTDVEMTARAFEAWAIEQNSNQGITNDYLANVTQDNGEIDYPYPTKKEMADGISAAYTDFVDAINTETDGDGNVNLYRLDAGLETHTPTKADVEGFVKDIFKDSPDIAHAQTKVEVVNSESELPNHIQYQIINDGVEGKVNGLYDPQSQKVFLIASKVPTKEHAERFIFHELVGHYGLRSLFGGDINKELAAIRTHLGGKAGVLKLARKMGVDLSQYVDMVEGAVSNNQISTEQADYILFDELLAHVAERNQMQGVVDRLVQKVKSWLRRHGFNSLAKYGKSDLMELLTNIRTSLNNPPPTNPPKGKGRANYSLDSRPSVDKVLNTKQTNLVKRIKAAIGGFSPIEALSRNKYAMLTLRQIGEVAGFKNKTLGNLIDGYQQEINSMITTQNTLAEEAATISEDLSKWAKKNRKSADEVFEFAHDATLADVDPSKAFESRTDELKDDIKRLERAYQEYGGSGSERGQAIFEELKEMRQLLKQEPNRQKEHLRLRPLWGRLSKEQKAKFREMRDHYIKQGERFDKALEENINRAVEDQKIRKEMLTKLRQRQELRAKGLYFPLARFGDYWVDFADNNGERQYMMFESKAEMEAARDKLRDAGYSVNSGMKAQGNEGQQVSLPFVADVMGLIRESNMNRHNADTLADQVYQMYLRTLPGRSLRRNFIHRKGVEGFSNDAIRVLADNGFKQSRQQARLDHMDVLDNHLVNIKKFADTAPDNAEVSRIAEELDKRHEWVRNPSRSAWAQKLTSLGFTWLLGVTPAAALVNLTQNIQVAIPVLGSKHGFAKSSAMMAGTSKEFLNAAAKALTGKERKRGYGVMGNYLKGQELEAFREAVKQGVIDTTQAADLAGLAENPNAKYSGKWNKAMNLIGWSFHNAEVFNREVTFMSAYRLAKEKTGDHQKAIEQAINDTWESHFDYTSTNRARFMQSDMAAVALQFKQYSQNMTYYLWSNLAKSLKGETPEVKAQARKQLLSTLAMTFFIGGLGALPLSAITIAADAAQAAFGDDDEPWSAETELKLMLSQAVGKENAQLMWYGSMPSISGRISLNDLWVRSIDRDIDADKRYLEYIKQGLGPVLGGIGFSFAQGLGDIGDDFGMRSAEKMSPKAVKDMLKMVRYINEEGVYTRTGSEVIGDMSWPELFGQAIGFSSGRANIQYDQNNAIKNYEMHLTKRRSQLMNGYYTAYRLGDQAALKEVMEKIQKWNQSKYGRMNPIDNKSIKRSINARLRNLAKTNSGVRINDKYQSLISEYDYF
ncbi:PLxRFG domain-containing protein [Vibrio mediterranei]